MSMEAPEKIYIHPDIGDKNFIKPWLPKRFNQNSVEYTRTDASIEKAANFLSYKLYDTVKVRVPGKATESIMGRNEFVEEFKKEMTQCLPAEGIDDLPEQESVSEGLDIDAIKEELYKAIRIYKPNGDFGWGTLYNIAYHFANWQKQQMMKDAVHGDVDYPFIGHDFPNVYPNYRELKDYCDRYNIKDNDRVKLIIIKED